MWTLIYACLRFWFVVPCKLSAAHVKAWRKFRRRHLSHFIKTIRRSCQSECIQPYSVPAWLSKMWCLSSISESSVLLSSRSMCIWSFKRGFIKVNFKGGNSDRSLLRSLQGGSDSTIKEAIAKLYFRTTKNCGRLSGHHILEVCPGP